jgi:hypothetical protein
MTTHYEGSPWHADESDDVVRFHREHMQVFKAVKRSHEFAAYWPGPQTIQWMLAALNERERTCPLPHSVND